MVLHEKIDRHNVRIELNRHNCIKYPMLKQEMLKNRADILYIHCIQCRLCE